VRRDYLSSRVASVLSDVVYRDQQRHE